MPYPTSQKQKKAANSAFAICSDLKGAKRERCLNQVYQDKLKKQKKS
jgi:hypothetical protein